MNKNFNELLSIKNYYEENNEKDNKEIILTLKKEYSKLLIENTEKDLEILNFALKIKNINEEIYSIENLIDEKYSFNNYTEKNDFIIDKDIIEDHKLVNKFINKIKINEELLNEKLPSQGLIDEVEELEKQYQNLQNNFNEIQLRNIEERQSLYLKLHKNKNIFFLKKNKVIKLKKEK